MACDMERLVCAIEAGDPHSVPSSEHRRNTSLHIAAKLGYEELVKSIIDRNPSLLNHPNKEGDNPLHVAARAGHLPIVKLLTDHSSQQRFQQSSHQGYPIWRTRNNEGNTALHVALLSKHEEVALHLLDLEREIVLDVNADDAGPLYLAAEAGFVRVLIKILLAGGGQNIAGPSGQTPLHASIFARSTENIEALHEWIPGLAQKQDSNGKAALHHAITLENSYAIVDLLLKLDASSANIRDNEGLSPLLVAAATGNLEAVKAILKACPTSVDCSDNRGRNSLHLALNSTDINSFKEWFEMPEFNDLLRQPDKTGKTPQDLATSKYSPVARFQAALFRKEAKSSEEMTDLNENMRGFSVVASLLATVTFAAVFQIPGGYKANGSPLLIYKPALKVFLISDTIAFCCSIVAVVSSTSYSKRGGGVDASTYEVVLALFAYALLAAMVAFLSGLYAVISLECEWMAILVCVIGCCIFILLWDISTLFDDVKVVTEAHQSDSVLSLALMLFERVRKLFRKPS